MSGCTLKLMISPRLLVHEELVVNYCIITGLLLDLLKKIYAMGIIVSIIISITEFQKAYTMYVSIRA